MKAFLTILTWLVLLGGLGAAVTWAHQLAVAERRRRQQRAKVLAAEIRLQRLDQRAMQEMLRVTREATEGGDPA